MLQQKTPNEVEDFTINWATRGLGTDTIASSDWTISPAGSLTISSNSSTSTTTTAWFSGGISGTFYIAANTVTTAGGRTFEQEVPFFVYE